MIHFPFRTRRLRIVRVIETQEEQVSTLVFAACTLRGLLSRYHRHKGEVGLDTLILSFELSKRLVDIDRPVNSHAGLFAAAFDAYLCREYDFLTSLRDDATKRDQMGRERLEWCGILDDMIQGLHGEGR